MAEIDYSILTDAFSFDLPPELIAQSPPEKRGTGRLMVLDRSIDNIITGIQHKTIMDLPDLIPSGALLVFNDTKVRRARLWGTNAKTGGICDFLFLEPVKYGETGNFIGQDSNEKQSDWMCIVKKVKKKHVGQEWLFPGGVTGTIIATPGTDIRVMRLNPSPAENWFETQGHIPLPPYIRRPDNEADVDRYQTVYARYPGSVAAPTAGLHFTRELLDSLAECGIGLTWISLHVGFGTFAPVRSQTITDHRMHSEKYSISEETALTVNTAKADGRPIIAVGTTSVRTLESAWTESGLIPGNGDTDIFIYPGYQFKATDALLTNFHTPKSTLLMLVCAFGGMDRILESYKVAVGKKYRFYSYGDAMLIV